MVTKLKFLFLFLVTMISLSDLCVTPTRGAEVHPSLLDHPQIDALTQATNSHYLLRHDFLRCFSTGQFADMTSAAKIFFENHYVYSRNFITYLGLVAEKVGNRTIAEPILENMDEENGIYDASAIAQMTSRGISQEWFDGIPHANLSRRFLKSVEVEPGNLNRRTAPSGTTFTSFMMDAYKQSNVCEALAIIGFAIEQTVSVLYQYLWDGLEQHTNLTPDEYVFFPLHILIDDGHSDLLKLAYKHYLDKTEEHLCERTPEMVRAVMDRRVQMFDEVRLQIERAQNFSCGLPYSSLSGTPSRDYLDEEAIFGRKKKRGKRCSQEETVTATASVIRSSVDVDGAVKQAQVETAKLQSGHVHSQWTLQQRIAMSARILGEQGHGGTLSGQITCREESGMGEVHMWATPYGLPLEIVASRDVILLDSDLNVLRGERIANRATRFHFHVYEKRPDIKCLVHTHPLHVSALAMTGEPLHVAHMDVMAFFEDVQHLSTWPGIPFGDEEGEIISRTLKDKWSALLGHHGLIVGGRNIEEATYRAYFFERAAKIQLQAMAATKDGKLPRVESGRGKRARDWRISDGPVQAHFNGWAMVALGKGHGNAL